MKNANEGDWWGGGQTQINAEGAKRKGAAEQGGVRHEGQKGGRRRGVQPWMWVCAGVVLAVIVAAVVVLVHKNTATTCGDGAKNGGNCTEAEVAAGEEQTEDGGAGLADDTDDLSEILGVELPLKNTELSSGSVTTTIDGKSVTYTAAYVVDGIEATIGSGTWESLNDDEAVFLVINGGSLTIVGYDVTVHKGGSVDFSGRGDDYSFYGINSAIVVVGENSSASIIGPTITTDVSGANAVVATNGGMVGIGRATIETYRDNSRGLHATYKGLISADRVQIHTRGGSSASLATDRGEGYVGASAMTLTTEGAGSPLVYSTGQISVTDSTGAALGAQAVVVEGKNSVELTNCELSAKGVGNRGEVDNAVVMIYQSMSGDAGVGVGQFSAKNSTLSVLKEVPSTSTYDEVPFFFVTNTTAEIALDNVTAEFAEGQYLIVAEGTNEWGRSGSNGGEVTITATGLTATNTEIYTDGISSVSGL